MANLTALCEQYLLWRYRIEVIDLTEDFAPGRADDIIAVPTLIRRQPIPARRIIGDLSDADRLATALQLPAA